MSMIHMESIARRKTNSPADWELFKWERIGDDLVVEGGIPRILKTGKNKGDKTWRDSETTKAIVTFDEIEKEEMKYENETGLCSQCFGKKEVFKSWDHEKGTKYQPCKKCNATGDAPF